MMITLAAKEATAMPVYGPDNPARTTAEKLAAIDAGATVNEFYELVYPATVSGN